MNLRPHHALTLLPPTLLGLTLWALLTGRLPVSVEWPWVPSLGLDLAFTVDGLGALMLLMITGVGSAVFVYAAGYHAGDPKLPRLFVLLSVFLLAMVGCVTTDDLFVFFVFWETTSVVSFFLVGYKHEKSSTRSAARQALLVTGTGGLALLVGVILLTGELDTSRISLISERLRDAEQTPRLLAALGFMVLGALTKSAQAPFHFWLPNAMAAPTPVSAYLHSATMVKLGIFLLARLDAGVGDWPAWTLTLKILGSITATWGMVQALRERDLKRILAWSTVATLGTLTMLVGVDGKGAPVAVGALLLAHALYKAPLFFVAGNVDHGTGTRVIDELGGLRRQMPFTAAAALLAGLSMAGMPTTLGYAAKDLVGELKQAGAVLVFAEVANTIFAGIAVAVAGVAAVRIFWRHPGKNVTPKAHEGNLAMVLPPLVLAGLGVALGLMPGGVETLLARAADAMSPTGVQTTPPDLAIDLLPALAGVAVTLLVGAGVYLGWDRLHGALDRVAQRIGPLGMVRVYDAVVGSVPRFASSVTRALQHGRLPTYALLLAAVAALTVLGATWLGGPDLDAAMDGPLPAGGVAGCLLVAFGALLTCVARKRIVLVLAAGVVGFGCAGLFLFAGAPDLAFTQFTVETIFVVVATAALLSLSRLERRAPLEPRLRPLPALVAAAFGVGVTGVILVMAGASPDPALSDFFGAESLPSAYGLNVVNVILVDFRGFDTLGEITVLLFSLLAALPLLAGLAPSRRRGPET